MLSAVLLPFHNLTLALQRLLTRTEESNQKMGTPEKEPHLIQLPPEVLEKIGDKLDYPSSLNLRLTCSTLKSLIDNYVGLKVDFDEPMPYPKKKMLNLFGRVCMQEVNSKNMIGQLVASNGLRTYFKHHYYFDDLFRFPHLLKVIRLDGKTNIQFLFDVITKCTNLEGLSLIEGFEFQGDLVSLLTHENNQIEFNINPNERSKWLSMISRRKDIFRQVKFTKLNIFYLYFENKISNNNLLNVMLLLKCIRSDAMKRAFLSIGEIKGMTEMEFFHFSSIVADFLQAHFETLKDLSFCIQPPQGPKLTPDLNIVLPNLFNKHIQRVPNEILGDGDSVDNKIKAILFLRQKLDEIGGKAKLTYLTIQIPPDFHWDFWLLFVEKLKNLIHLRIMVSTKYQILKNCDFIKNSKKSLKRLRMDLDVVNNFDFSGIEECEKLEEVYVFNRPISPELISQGPLEAHVKNASLIPAGVKGLCLGNVVVASEDLNKMLSVQKHLDTLVVMNMPSNNPDNGIDCKCLKKIFRMRNLHSCLVQNVRSKSKKTAHRVTEMLDFQMTPKDKEVMKKLDHIMGYPPFQSPHILDILSTEIYCRYSWKRMVFPDGNLCHYSIKFNDLDPYL